MGIITLKTYAKESTNFKLKYFDYMKYSFVLLIARKFHRNLTKMGSDTIQSSCYMEQI